MRTYENIKALREARGLSQEELARLVGYRDRSSIAKIENGGVDLTQSKIKAFADALRVSPARLMGIDDPTVPELLPDAGEEKLVDIYRSLNEEGQEVLVDYAETMTFNPRYKKDDTACLGERQA